MTRTVQAVDRARGAAARWRAVPPAARSRHLTDAAHAVRAEEEALATLLTRTTGKLLEDSRSSVRAAASLLDEAAVTGLVTVGGRWLAGAPGSIDHVRPEPRGVVGVITPWNDPYPAAAGLIAAALVTGNTVVHKPSERSGAAGQALTRVLSESLPENVLVHLEGDADTGRELTAADVDLVAHVGGSTAGASVRRECAIRGAASLTENGGKDPLLVDAGVDPRWAAAQAAVGAFANAGQLCSSIERIYVHEEVADPFLDELVHRAEALVLGDPMSASTTMAPLVDGRAVGKVESHVEDASSRGARVLTGGARSDCFPHAYRPTVLADCSPDMLVMREESFGPVAPVMVVGSWEEGLEEANSGPYGLGATVLTADQDHVMAAVEGLDVGTVRVNAVFGGAPAGSADPRRGSGRGIGFGPDLLREMVLLKAVHVEPGRPRVAP